MHETFGETIKFYRLGSVAFCAQCVKAQDEKQTETLNLEMAPYANSPLWEDKITVQVSRMELPMVAKVLLKKIPSFKAMYHGPQKNKGYGLGWTDKNQLAIELFAPQIRRYLFLNESETFWFTDLFLRQFRQSTYFCSINEMIAIL